MDPAPPAFAALDDPHRREILAMLVRGEHSVTAIAAALPISRPAVSHHLAMLYRSGLVEVRAEGTRRFYRAAPGGIAEARAFLEELWSEATTRLQTVADGARQTR